MSSDGLDRLDVPHRRLVAFHKTAAARDSAIRESLNLLSTFILFALVLSLNPLAASVEMLLLLIWRHIDHYSNPPAKEEAPAGTSVSPTAPAGTWGIGFFSPWKSTAKPATPLSKSTWATSAALPNQQQSWLAAKAFRRDIRGALQPVLSYLDSLQLVRV